MKSEAIMTLRLLTIIILLMSLPISFASNGLPPKQRTVYDYSLVGLDGKEIPLSTYKGKVLLIVTLASQSIYANQIAALKEIQTKYAEKGLVLLGLPSSDFGGEELADNAAIEHYYNGTEHVNFPVFAKTVVRGKDAIPLVRFLTDAKLGTSGGDIHWSFTKFVVDRDGHPVIRFEADSDPADPEFKVKLEQVLNGTYKAEPHAKEVSASPGDEDEDDD